MDAQRLSLETKIKLWVGECALMRDVQVGETQIVADHTQ